MSITNVRRTTIASQLVVAAFAGLLSLATLAADTDTQSGQEVRSSKSVQFRDGGRSNNRDTSEGTATVDRYDPLQTAGGRTSGQSKLAAGSATGAQATGFDFWIYDADVILFNDDDFDGHFFGIDLLFDADTIYGAADVYAAVYLSLDGGPWNEYAVTDDFTIFGASGDDEYVLVTELMTGYPTGSYDLLIDLFDANDGAFLASFGPEDSSNLGFLPLEDFDRDAPVTNGTVVVVSEGGGGAAGLWLLLALGLLTIGRYRATSAAFSGM